ncbi:GlcG/HbpS family heme-binding protein [Sphingomonas abietis]|uniref:Heme-binding protein n=1 Tax=Sphingomonas abietis TaxID=3012344 RepID=A0ABY7NIH1_9SPHN|nr:heme-binding protein [Sphingomonas abietis]WBO21324.1 heme-binding protein [Sphingomonas abietis]
MSKRVASLTITALAMTMGGAAFAQAPSVPAAIPFDIPYGASISLDAAKAVATAAEAEAKRRGWKDTIVVVGPAGEPVLIEKMDGTMLGASKVAEGKAVTAANFRRPTKAFQDLLEGGHSIPLALGVTPAEGGFPLIEAGRVIGAIGVSGGDGSQDTIVAQAGVAGLR